MEKKYCQSCGMPMDELSIMGTNEDLSMMNFAITVSSKDISQKNVR